MDKGQGQWEKLINLPDECMDKGQGQWEKLINLPDECEGNPSIAQRAIAEIERRETQKAKKNWFARNWKSFLSCAAGATAGIALAIAIPMLNRTTAPQVTYYHTYDISYEPLDDNTNAFIAEKNLNVRYFSDKITQLAFIDKTGEFVYLEQDVQFINGSKVDKVLLRSVVKRNAEFAFHDSYNSLTEMHTIKDLIVKYKFSENSDIGNKQVFAKFSYQDVDYYLEISTEQDGVERLEAYVTMLLG